MQSMGEVSYQRLLYGWKTRADIIRALLHKELILCLDKNLLINNDVFFYIPRGTKTGASITETKLATSNASFSCWLCKKEKEKRGREGREVRFLDVMLDRCYYLDIVL